MRAAALTEKSDVYSLGALLYELLTLHPAFANSSFERLREQIREGRFSPLREKNSAIAWDVETVCLTALAIEPRRRYSAEEFHRDLENVSSRRPIEAQRASLLLRARRWSQRHPTLSSVLVLGALAISITSIIAFQNSRLASSERKAKLQAQQAANQAETASRRAERELRASEVERSRLLARADGHVVAEPYLWRGHLKDPTSALSYWALWELYQNNPCLMTCGTQGDWQRCVAFSPDGSTLATGTDGGRLHLWDQGSGKLLQSLDLKAGRINSLCFDPRGTRLAIGNNSGEAIIRSIDVPGPDRRFNTGTGISQVAFSPDGALLAIADHSGSVHLWDGQGEEARVTYQCGEALWSLKFDPHHPRVVAGSSTGMIFVCDLKSGQIDKSFQAHTNIVNSLAFHPTQPVMVSGGSDHRFRLWHTDDWTALWERETEIGGARALDFNQDGSQTLALRPLAR